MEYRRSDEESYENITFVVLAVSHPRHAFDTLHSNGAKQTVSMDYLREMSGMDPQSKPEEAAKLFAE